MKKTAFKLSQYASNNIISLRNLKSKNIYLYKLLLSNRLRLECILKDDYNIQVLDDFHLNEYRTFVLYIKYHYGDIVDISNLRKNHKSVYKKLKNPIEFLEKAGFIVKNGEQELRNILNNLKDINHINKQIYNKLYYRARCKGMSVKEYLEYLGFSLVDDKTILSLREKGFSIRKIAEIIGLPKSTVFNRYKRVKEGDQNNICRKSKC